MFDRRDCLLAASATSGAMLAPWLRSVVGAPATGKPLQLRLIPVRSLTKGRWISSQCPADAEDVDMDDAGSDAVQEDPAEE